MARKKQVAEVKRKEEKMVKVGECSVCEENFGGLGLTTSEICPGCGSKVIMDDPGEELRPYTIQILNSETFDVVATFETWHFSSTEDLEKDQKYPMITLKFPVENSIKEEEGL